MKAAKSVSVQLDGVRLNHQNPSFGNRLLPKEEEEDPIEMELEDEEEDPIEMELEVEEEEDTCILTQDFFCTPDYITPVQQQFSNDFEFNKDNSCCPKPPLKSANIRKKRHRQDGLPIDSNLGKLACGQVMVESNKSMIVEPPKATSTKKQNYVSQSAVALRCRVMSPPCIRNPFLDDPKLMNLGLFYDRKSIPEGFSIEAGDGLSRYHTDFHEIEQIGCGSFSRVFKVLRRIDGCMYAVKQVTRQLHDNTERRQALMEVQALAALGYHNHIVGYYTSWIENEKLYIQMELCDRSLSITKGHVFSMGEVIVVLHQIANALRFIHERGIAHLDVKPDNIYVKGDVHKLGDFGFATRINRELPVEEGDARYMPLEILNDNYEHLDKVDIFSLGATIYELVRGSSLPNSGSQFLNLRNGKIPLLPGCSVLFQNLIKTMMDPNPVKRPSAIEVLKNPIFDKIRPHSSS